jgi:hexosaminidase
MQGDTAIENRVYAGLRLNKTYEFEPVPKDIDPKFILGGQANLWTEQIYNLRYAEYMTWPRAMSISETLWSPKEKKNWDNFTTKVQEHFHRLDMAETNYAPSMFEPDIQVSLTADGLLKVNLQTEINGIDIYYSVDNSFPDRFYPKYTEAIVMPRGSTMLRMVSYKEKKQIGRLITISTEKLRNRINK